MRERPLEAYFGAIIEADDTFGDGEFNAVEFLHLAAKAINGWEMFACSDCDVNTSLNGEYYAVSESLWAECGVAQGMLCIGCLEERAGRELVAGDFIDAPINGDLFWRSDRMRDRLSRDS